MLDQTSMETLKDTIGQGVIRCYIMYLNVMSLEKLLNYSVLEFGALFHNDYEGNPWRVIKGMKALTTSMPDNPDSE